MHAWWSAHCASAARRRRELSEAALAAPHDAALQAEVVELLDHAQTLHKVCILWACGAEGLKRPPGGRGAQPSGRPPWSAPPNTLPRPPPPHPPRQMAFIAMEVVQHAAMLTTEQAAVVVVSAWPRRGRARM